MSTSAAKPAPVWLRVGSVVLAVLGLYIPVMSLAWSERISTWCLQNADCSRRIQRGYILPTSLLQTTLYLVHKLNALVYHTVTFPVAILGLADDDPSSIKDSYRLPGMDLSDHQWRLFREGLPDMLMAFAVLVALYHVVHALHRRSLSACETTNVSLSSTRDTVNRVLFERSAAEGRVAHRRLMLLCWAALAFAVFLHRWQVLIIAAGVGVFVVVGRLWLWVGRKNTTSRHIQTQGHAVSGRKWLSVHSLFTILVWGLALVVLVCKEYHVEKFTFASILPGLLPTPASFASPSTFRQLAIYHTAFAHSKHRMGNDAAHQYVHLFKDSLWGRRTGPRDTTKGEPVGGDPGLLLHHGHIGVVGDQDLKALGMQGMCLHGNLATGAFQLRPDLTLTDDADYDPASRDDSENVDAWLWWRYLYCRGYQGVHMLGHMLDGTLHSQFLHHRHREHTLLSRTTHHNKYSVSDVGLYTPGVCDVLLGVGFAHRVSHAGHLATFGKDYQGSRHSTPMDNHREWKQVPCVHWEPMVAGSDRPGGRSGATDDDVVGWMRQVSRYSSAPVGWQVCCNLLLLRCLSWVFDTVWGEVTLHDADGKLVRHSHSSAAPCARFDLLWGVAYLFFPPLYLAGPILRYKDLVRQVHFPAVIKWRRLLAYWGLWLCLLVALELILSVFPVYGVQSMRYPAGFDPSQSHTQVNGRLRDSTSLHLFENLTFLQCWSVVFASLLVLFLKFAVIWRLGRGVSMLLGIDCVENMGRFVYDNFMVQEFWRSWHRSFNEWLLRYLYIPLGGSRVSTPRRCLNVLCVFAFVALWHDFQLHLFIWGIAFAVAYIPEMLLVRWFRRSLQPRIYRHIQASGRSNVYVNGTGPQHLKTRGGSLSVRSWVWDVLIGVSGMVDYTFGMNSQHAGVLSRSEAPAHEVLESERYENDPEAALVQRVRRQPETEKPLATQHKHTAEVARFYTDPSPHMHFWYRASVFACVCLLYFALCMVGVWVLVLLNFIGYAGGWRTVWFGMFHRHWRWASVWPVTVACVCFMSMIPSVLLTYRRERLSSSKTS